MLCLQFSRKHRVTARFVEQTKIEEIYKVTEVADTRLNTTALYLQPTQREKKKKLYSID